MFYEYIYNCECEMPEHITGIMMRNATIAIMIRQRGWFICVDVNERVCRA